MEQPEVTEQPVINQSGNVNDTLAIAPSPASRLGMALSPQAGEKPCPTCGNTMKPNGLEAVRFVYALGRVEPRFPSLGVEKEFAQATARTETARLTDRQALQEILSQPQNRYLVRQLCWVFTVEGLETYLLQPRDPADFSLLVETLRSAYRPTDVDVVIGWRGPIAPPEMCNGLMVPIVIFDQIYSFDVDSLVNSIPRSDEVDAEHHETMAEELFWRIMQMADNAGATDEHRALNYLALRYPDIYHRTADQYGRDFSLTGVEARPSPLSSTRKIVEVIFSFTNRKTDFTEKFFMRVDVTEAFPFLVTKMSPYYDR